MNSEILKNISYGVYVVSTLNNEKSTGCIANSVMQVTQDVVAVSINHNNFTNECIKKSNKIAISILSQDVEDNIIPVFGFQTGREIDKFENIEKINIDNIDIESDKEFQAGRGKICFLAFDKLGKAHGGRRDILYMNEANHLHYNIVEQLMVRTRQTIFIDYNPTNEFWVHTKLLVEQPEETLLIRSTYKDNPFLN